MRFRIFLKKVGSLWLPHDMIEQIRRTCLQLFVSPLLERNALFVGTGNPCIAFFCPRIMTLYFRLSLQNFKESWFPRSPLRHELADPSPFVHFFSHGASLLEVTIVRCDFGLVIEIYLIYIVTFYLLSSYIP